jgi:Na+:H+ antiporter, NhaA family
MSLFRSERFAAISLLIAAAAGLAIANSPVGSAALDLKAFHLAIPGTPLDLSLGHWVSDGLLAVFFFLAAIELRHELTTGELNSPRKALRPAIAAAGGVLVPAGIYLALTAGSGLERGWPIPTATDIAFALGVLAVFGRGIPRRIRTFLLALAILDDIVAIVIIAVLFTATLNVGLLIAGVIGAAAFGALSLLLRTRARIPVAVVMVALAVATWMLVYLSGVHATIAGVLLGLAMTPHAASKVRHALEPVSNGVILPLFAFCAALVAFPQVAPTELSIAFWAIVIALPVGKVIGITAGSYLSTLVAPKAERRRPEFGDVIAVGALGGVGFTVSLLMNELAFAGIIEVRDEGTLAVLLGSVISLVAAAVLVSWRARVHRGRVAQPAQ